MANTIKQPKDGFTIVNLPLTKDVIEAIDKKRLMYDVDVTRIAIVRVAVRRYLEQEGLMIGDQG